MLQRGRKSAAAGLAVIDGTRGSRPEPTEELNDYEAAVWAKIVGALPADWFNDEHEQLLIAYCRHSYFVSKIDLQVKLITDAALARKPGRTRFAKLTGMREKHTRMLLSLSRAMRLTHQSVDKKTAGRQKRLPLDSAPKPWDA